ADQEVDRLDGRGHDGERLPAFQAAEDAVGVLLRCLAHDVQHRIGIDTPVCDTDPPESAIRFVRPCEGLRRGRIVSGRMASPARKLTWRIVVVTVPPVDELDLVGPLQVFNSVNRLAGRTIYTIDVATAGEGLTVDGDSGVLTFVAKHHFKKVEGACDSVLV